MNNKFVLWTLLAIQLIIVVLMVVFSERKGADPKWQEEEPTGIIGLEAFYSRNGEG